MTVKILIPTPLRTLTNNKEVLLVNGSTVGDLLQNLTREYSGLKKNLYTEDGRLRSFVNVYVNDEDIRYLKKEQTPVAEGDTISIIPSIAGG
jgi:molybdopterin converting factor small subunit